MHLHNLFCFVSFNFIPHVQERKQYSKRNLNGRVYIEPLENIYQTIHNLEKFDQQKFHMLY